MESVKLRFETVKEGLSIADSITKCIKKDLEKNFKGFLSKIDLILHNHINNEISQKSFINNK